MFIIYKQSVLFLLYGRPYATSLTSASSSSYGFKQETPLLWSTEIKTAVRDNVTFEDLVIEAENGGTIISLNENKNGDLEIQLPDIDTANITADNFLQIVA